MPDLAKRETIFGAALIALIIGVFVLFYKLMVPFFAPIAWAVILVISVHPFHRRIQARVRPLGLAALISTLGVALLILGPATYLIATLFGEAARLYTWLQGNWTSDTIRAMAVRIDPIIRTLAAKLEGLIDLSQVNFQSIAADMLGKLTKFIADHGTATLANLGKLALQFLMMLLTMYYLFKDGGTLVDKVKSSIPLPGPRADAMLTHITDVVRATIYGGLAIAGLQGFLGGLLFLIVGLPSPVLWGAVMAFFALIPLLGAFVVYVPAAFILFASGAYVKGMILLVVGVAVVSQIDNFLRPLIISGRTQLHPLLLFFAIAGGVSVFGLLGLVLGPVVAALFVGIFEVYRMTINPPEVDEDAEAAPPPSAA
jgi:predicted PurR-regulated permease PerM